MTGQQTAPGPRLNELHKARARTPLVVLIVLVLVPLAGVGSLPVWVAYTVFAIAYGLWALRLTSLYSSDQRLGLVLCVTDTALFLPLLVWIDSAAGRAGLVLVCAAGWVYSLLARRAARAGRTGRAFARLPGRSSLADGRRGAGTEVPLERAVRERLSLFASTGARFAVVVLRVLRFEEAAAYYGLPVAERMLHAVARRGLRLLGPDAQHFHLPGGRVAFLFQTDPPLRPEYPPVSPQAPEVRQQMAGNAGPVSWSEPYDIEGLAMAVGRKACEHLVDGHRVECVVGWASAPADGLTADDLLYVAETGAQSTEAFRRVGAPVSARERARAAAG
jgi:GGDEF domain-containing protein